MPDHLLLMSLFNQATEAIRRVDYEAAKRYAEEMLEHHRKDLNARSLLAQIESLRGNDAAALDLWRGVIKDRPRDVEFRLRCGECCQSQGLFRQALEQFDKARRLDEKNPAPIGALANLYEHQGKRDRARALLDPLLARGGPTPPEIAGIGIRLLMRDGKLDEAMALGKQAVADARQDAPALRGVLLSLARAYERAGRYDDALDVAARGHAINAPVFDRDQFRGEVDALTTILTADRLAALPRPADASTVPVFLVGMPRSGSTLLERIIAAHPQADGAGEITTLHVMLRELPARLGSSFGYPGCVDDLRPEHVETLSRDYLDDLRKRCAKNAVRVTNKNLGNVRHLGMIQVLFPGARIVHCRRDPLDTCVSCYMERLAPGTVPFTNDLADAGWYYGQYERLMAHWRTVIDLSILDFEYADLVNDQEAATRRLLEFLDLPWDDACLRFHETTRQELTASFDQVRQPIYRSSLGRAARFGALLDPLRQALEEGRVTADATS